MGKQPKKYYISDNGNVYKVNDDGSFTSLGNVENIDRKPSESNIETAFPTPKSAETASSTSKDGWWKRNCNWLWLTTLVIFIGWFISCLSCSRPDYPIYEGGYIVNYYHADNSYAILVVSMVVIICFVLSWHFSSKGKLLYKFFQIPLVIFCGWVAINIYWLCEQQYSFLLLCLASVPFILWIISICISLFGSKKF